MAEGGSESLREGGQDSLLNDSRLSNKSKSISDGSKDNRFQAGGNHGSKLGNVENVDENQGDSWSLDGPKINKKESEEPLTGNNNSPSKGVGVLPGQTHLLQKVHPSPPVNDVNSKEKVEVSTSD